MEWYNWVLCILLFFIVPATVILWRIIAVYAKDKGNYDNKKFIRVSIFQTLFYWFLGAFHLCAIFNVLAWTFIFGGISMVIIFYNLANVFINKVGTSKTLNKLGLLQDFIVGLVITVYLIYIIPEEFKTLQTIITAVVAAVYGGLLTLTGVAWTIRNEREVLNQQEAKRIQELKLEERKKYKPLFNIYKGDLPDGYVTVECHNFDNIQEISFGFMGDCSNAHKVIIGDFSIENTDFTEFYIRGIKINSVTYLRHADLFIRKNQQLSLTFDNECLYLNEPLNSLSLIVDDIIGNVYEMKLGFESDKDNENRIIVTGNKRLSLEDMI